MHPMQPQLPRVLKGAVKVELLRPAVECETVSTVDTADTSGCDFVVSTTLCSVLLSFSLESYKEKS